MFQVQRKQKYMHHRARERQEEKRTPRPHNIPFITRHMDDPARLNAFRRYKVLKNLRSTRNMTPVLMLTARSELSDRVRGLDAGADYYLTKPFATEEFLACLRTVLRRHGDIAPDTLTFGDLILTPSMPELICGENSVSLSAKELELMSLLIQNSSQYLPKETILLKVWGYDANVNSNSVEAYISFLRKKLSLLGSCVSISVMRNIGYKLGVSNRILALADILLKLCTSAASLFFLDIFFLLSNE